MIDLHAHVLPGIDDGPASTDAARELLVELAADGIEIVAATPHVRDDFPTTPAQIARALAEVRAAATREGLEIEILPGAEVALDRVRFAVHDGSLSAYALAGNPRYLLVEFPYHGWPLDLVDVVRALAGNGICPVLAHPERNGAVQDRPEQVATLVEAGALVQVTASSVVGVNGTRVARAARILIEKGLVHLLATDAHGPAVRRAPLSAACALLGDDVLARWLTAGVPGAIVHDTPLPGPPDGVRVGRGRPWDRLVGRRRRGRG